MLFLSKKCAALRVEKNGQKKFGLKQNKQITVGATVCFNGCQTSNVWRQNTSCGNPIRTSFFVPCPCLDASDGIAVCGFQHIFLGVVQCMFFLLVDNGF